MVTMEGQLRRSGPVVTGRMFSPLFPSIPQYIPHMSPSRYSKPICPTISTLDRKFTPMQFGHNDQKPENNVTVPEFIANLKQFVTDVRSAGGTAVHTSQPNLKQRNKSTLTLLTDSHNSSDAPFLFQRRHHPRPRRYAQCHYHRSTGNEDRLH